MDLILQRILHGLFWNAQDSILSTPLRHAHRHSRNKAAIPGDGNKLVTFTHTSDVGKFVAASLDLEKWDRVSVIIGDKVTMNEAVKLAAEAKGEP